MDTDGQTRHNSYPRDQPGRGRGRGRGNPIPGMSSHTLPSNPAPPTRSIATPNTRPVSVGARPTLQEVFDEIRRGHEEQRRMKEEMRRMGQDIQKIADEFKELNDLLKVQAEASFSIENSIYKNDLLRETGLLYIKSLRRKPSTEDITQAIVRALQQESRNRNKFFKAKTFVSNRLTELRCEERRRVFGLRPCENFVNFTTPEFAERFFGSAKASTASGEVKSQYIRHLALLRKYVREEGSRTDTFKKFRDWLDRKYTLGNPQQDEWEAIEREDAEYVYAADPTPFQGEDNEENSYLPSPINFEETR